LGRARFEILAFLLLKKFGAAGARCAIEPFKMPAKRYTACIKLARPHTIYL
jgi:hypothetical protein